jgi:hypothetical protein
MLVVNLNGAAVDPILGKMSVRSDVGDAATITRLARGWLMASASQDLRIHKQLTTFFVAITEAGVPYLEGREQHVWLNRLARDYENITAALRWCTQKAACVTFYESTNVIELTELALART